MKKFFNGLRFAFYVCALPMLATVVVAAQTSLTVTENKVESFAFTNVKGISLEDVSTNISHSLTIDELGGVTGQILARNGAEYFGNAGMDVSLNLQGKTIASGVTSTDGSFRFENVAAGAYTFIANSEQSIATFGVYVHEAVDTVPSSDDIQFSVAATGSNVGQVRDMLNSDVQAVSYTYTPQPSELPFVGDTPAVGLSVNNEMTGRVVPLLWNDSQPRFDMTGNSVYLFNEQGMVAETSVDSEGYYSLQNVQPGIYDFVSFGPHGAAAMSIEVVGDQSLASDSSDFSLVSSRKVVQDGYEVVLGEPTVGAPQSVVVEVIVEQPPAAGGYGYDGGGFGGGFGGGGGGGGLGGFDIGGIVGAALGAYVLTELFDSIDNNSNNGVIRQPVVVPPVIVPPASPF